MQFKNQFEAANGKGSANQFAAHAFDVVIMLQKAVPIALKKSKPGTPEFRAALKDAFETMGRTPAPGPERRSRTSRTISNQPTGFRADTASASFREDTTSARPTAAQPKLLAAKSQLASELMKVSAHFGRRLR